MNILMLDDDSSRYTEFKERSKCNVDYVYTVSQMIERLRENRYDYLLLDHDLDLTDTQTGQDAAKWLANNVLHIHKDMKIIIHSLNSHGVAHMMTILRHLTQDVIAIPWLWTKVQESKNYLVITI